MIEKPHEKISVPQKVKSLFSVKNLHVSFQQRDHSLIAVNNIDFSIRPKEIVGIVGESGSGKSVSMLASINLLPAHGTRHAQSILWKGTEIVDYTENQMKKILGKEITYIYQEPSQSYDPLANIYQTFKEFFLAHEPAMSKKEILSRSITLLEEVGIYAAHNRIKSYFHQFSGGMIQRVQIALALSFGPQLLIADEPTTALDVTTQKRVIDLLLDLCRRREMAMIFITHDLALVSSMVDRILVMKDGKIVEEGSPNKILYKPVHPYTQQLLNATIRFGDKYDG